MLLASISPWFSWQGSLYFDDTGVSDNSGSPNILPLEYSENQADAVGSACRQDHFSSSHLQTPCFSPPGLTYDGRCHFPCAYCVPRSVLNGSYVLAPGALTIFERWASLPPFLREGGTEAQRGEETCPEMHSWRMGNPRSKMVTMATGVPHPQMLSPSSQ